MLKVILPFSIGVFFSFSVSAEVAMVCSTFHYSKVKKIVEAKGSHDKYKHCAVSCLLALRCNPADVRQLGLFKEGIDLLGPGNAEMADLKADFKGVDFAVKKKARTDDECIQKCHEAYPANPSC